MKVGVFPTRTRPSTSQPAGLHPLIPEQEAQAQVEMAASDEPAFDWLATVGGLWISRSRDGWPARTSCR